MAHCLTGYEYSLFGKTDSHCERAQECQKKQQNCCFFMTAAPLNLHVIHTCTILSEAMHVLNEKFFSRRTLFEHNFGNKFV